MAGDQVEALRALGHERFTVVGHDRGARVAISFLHLLLGGLGSGLDVYAPEVLAEYERCFAVPAAIHGMCEDYRAAASIDLVHDGVDRDRLIGCPVLLLWGARGPVGALYDPIEVWREYATDVRGQALDAGHFLVEERPRETLAALRAFLDARA